MVIFYEKSSTTSKIRIARFHPRVDHPLPRTLQVLPNARVNKGLNIVREVLVAQRAVFNADDEVDVIHS
jgi:hypothetical protein